MERYPEAIAAYRQAVKSNPQQSMARYKLAYLLEASGDIDEAIQQAMVVLRLNPVSSNTRITLGNLYRRQGRLDEALEEYKAAAKLGQLAPQQALGYEKLGEVLQEMGESSGAIAMLQTAIRINPKAIFSYLHLARIHRDEGRLGEAVEMAAAAVKVDPRYPEAIALLGELQELVQQRPQACSRLADCLALCMDVPTAQAGTNGHAPIHSVVVEHAQHERLQVANSTTRDVRPGYFVEPCIVDAGHFGLPDPSWLSTASRDARDETTADQVAESFTQQVMLVTWKAECLIGKDNEVATNGSLFRPSITTT